MMMALPIDPKHVHRRTVQLKTFEDGLWDILTGLIFLLLGIYPVTRAILGPYLNLILFLVVMLVFVSLFQIARQRYSDPRLGVVKMRPPRVKIFIVVLTGILVLLTMAFHFHWIQIPDFLRALFNNLPIFIKQYGVDLAAGLLILFVFCTLGAAFGVRRLYLYGFLIAVGSLVPVLFAPWYRLTINLPLVLASLIILLVGVVLFARFLHRYPLPSKDQEANRD
jgi:hypothetical protein